VDGTKDFDDAEGVALLEALHAGDDHPLFENDGDHDWKNHKVEVTFTFD
jgi:hypothetical protein